MESHLQEQYHTTTQRENECPHCRRCGKRLISQDSKDLGFGPQCYKKHLAEQQGRPLFEVKHNE